MTEKLKPCPFCGGRAEMLGDDVICSKCFALMTENTARGESMGYEVSPVEMWNTRAECRHAKPRTLEDVLADFAAEVENGRNHIETARRYADELREMGVGE